jgi:hypothetical protein
MHYLYFSYLLYNDNFFSFNFSIYFLATYVFSIIIIINLNLKVSKLVKDIQRIFILQNLEIKKV